MSIAPRRLGKHSDVGLVREINEDSAIAVELRRDVGEDPVYLLVVADGMGGHQAGEIASGIAIQAVAQAVASRVSSRDPFDPTAALEEGFDEANRRIYEWAQEEAHMRGMGTTLTAAIVWGGRVYLGHVGDSRALLIHNHRVRQLSRDHSVVQEKLSAGLITEAEARSSLERNLLTRAVGTRPLVVCDITYEDLKEGDRLVLSTDGLHGSVEAGMIGLIASQCQDPQVLCESLVQTARELDGADNITAVAFNMSERFYSEASGRPRGSGGDPRRLGLCALLALVAIIGGFLARDILHPASTGLSSGISSEPGVPGERPGGGGTESGQFAVIPKGLLQLNRASAIRAVRSAGLCAQVVSVGHRTAMEGLVFLTHPEEGKRARKGARVLLFVSRGPKYGTFECQRCGACYLTSRALSVHLKAIHGIQNSIRGLDTPPRREAHKNRATERHGSTEREAERTFKLHPPQAPKKSVKSKSKALAKEATTAGRASQKREVKPVTSEAVAQPASAPETSPALEENRSGETP